MAAKRQWNHIPTRVSEAQFSQYILLYLTLGSRGPQPKLELFAIFNYILRFLHMGCQWAQLPVEKNRNGQPEIHYTRIYKFFRRWEEDGCFDAIFENSVLELHQNGLLDTRVLHCDGSTAAAKKGGDNLGFSGHKRFKGDKVVPVCDRNCNVVVPFVSAPGNRNESPLLREVLPKLTRMARTAGIALSGTVFSLDGVFDCSANRKSIFNGGMIPNISPNRRGRKKPQRGRKPLFDPAIFKERFRTIERVFAWEDKFKRVLIRFERLSKRHYALKTLWHSR